MEALVCQPAPKPPRCWSVSPLRQVGVSFHLIPKRFMTSGKAIARPTPRARAASETLPFSTRVSCTDRRRSESAFSKPDRTVIAAKQVGGSNCSSGSTGPEVSRPNALRAARVAPTTMSCESTAMRAADNRWRPGLRRQSGCRLMNAARKASTSICLVSLGDHGRNGAG